MNYLKVKNWETFQHYKDRNPPWIKLASDTFQNYEFSCLQDASKLLAICIWTLASRYKDIKLGLVPYDLEYIKSQCGLGELVQEEHLNELIYQGFISDASEMLADCKHDASPETERETETETEREAHTQNFKNLEITEEAKKFAEDERGLTGEALSRCWKKFVITKRIRLGKDWLPAWKKWVFDERIRAGGEQNNNLPEIPLTGTELVAQRLRICKWKRDKKMFLNAMEAKLLADSELFGKTE